MELESVRADLSLTVEVGQMLIAQNEALQRAHYRASTWSITLQPAGVACSCTFFLFDSSGRCDGG